MDWAKLYFGKLDRKDIKEAVADQEWQSVRISMKGVSLETKYHTLVQWLKRQEYCKSAQVQVTNYVTALSRGGLIKPKDYLK